MPYDHDHDGHSNNLAFNSGYNAHILRKLLYKDILTVQMFEYEEFLISSKKSVSG